MLFERLFDDTLAQSSYLLGCQSTGIAIVVDPNRDVDKYLRAAEREHLTIAFVTETHIHADFVSGARDLVRRSGAKLLLSAEGGDDWQYRFAESDGARLLRHGDRVDVGQVHLEVRHTPGHTPEHICFVVTDLATNDRPLGMLSGDFLFVGDVGRPDLLERAAGAAGSMDTLSRTLFGSLRALHDLPDYLQIWPGHGAGSACGKALGAMPSSTLGYERLANWAFQLDDEDEFVRQVLAGQPEPPRYFAVMKAMNRDGPPPARVDQHLPELDVAGLKRAIAAGASIVDVRPTAEFAAGHIPGALNLPAGSSLATWAGSLLGYDRQIVLLADNAGHLARARHALTLIGLDRVIGWGGAALRTEWQRDEGPVRTVQQIAMETLATHTGRVVFDVRSRAEWNAGHLPNAVHRFLGDLLERTRNVARDTPIAVHCQGGTRSAIAASLLQAHGFTNVANVVGGYRAWEAAGLPIEHTSPDRSEADA
ncbi:MAG: beta-lactamase domain protein [Gemmatimonadetes bacterium]|nr:beta-lactamase domain protein [Gemmatimonadota bacterium]